MITLHGGVTITIQGARREVSGSWIIAYGTDTFSVAAGYDLMTGERSGGYSCATTPALILAPSLRWWQSWWLRGVHTGVILPTSVGPTSWEIRNGGALPHPR